MEETVLYKRIAEEIRQEILSGRLQPGDRLPSIRNLKAHWRCTPGTIQRAYQELAQQGLVVSQAGQGTHVSGQVDLAEIDSRAPLRRANLVNRAEGFMLEAFSAGYALDEIEQALEVAKDRWRAAAQQQNQPDQQLIRFAGSHDMVVIWLAGHLGEICPGASLQLSFNGSLGGLMALAGGKAELAGCHLLDAETGVYNEPYLRKLFPAKRMLTVRLALRRIGLITAPGNPKDLRDLQHLAQPGLRFVNRQPGSGTRVWLDGQLRRLNLDPSRINGYTIEKLTHSEVARAVAEGQADAGLGLQSAAAAFSLGFIPLVEEPYDLVTYQDLAGQPHLKALFEWLAAPANWSQMAHLPGYDFSQTGQVSLLDL